MAFYPFRTSRYVSRDPILQTGKPDDYIPMSPMANVGSRWSLVGITLPEYVSLSKPKFSWSIHRVDIHRVDIYRVDTHRVDIYRWASIGWTSIGWTSIGWSVHRVDIIYRVDIHRVDIYRVGIHRVDIHRVFASLELSQGMGGALWRSPVCTP